jgi:hypothetical protein
MKDMEIRPSLSGPTSTKSVAVLTLAAAALFAASSVPSASSRPSHPTFSPQSISTLTQESANSEDEDEVPADEVDKYVAVYLATQNDRSLTIEQAAARQGMTIEAFRQLENRVQRDDVAMEHVRDALKKAAAGASSPTPSGNSDKKSN